MNGKYSELLLRYSTRIILFIWMIIVVYPMLWTLQTSFKTNKEFYQNIWSLPKILHFENYTNAWVKANVSTSFFNSIYVTGLGLIISIILVTTAAYVLGRFSNKLTRVLSFYFIVSYMIPGSIAIIAQFFMMQRLHLLNSLNGLSIKYIADSIPFSLFVLTGFFRTLPKELEESAEMDGAGYFRTFYRIMLPLAKPGIMTVCIFDFIGFWNEYFFALIMMTDKSKYTIPVGIANILAMSQFRTDWGMVFAACVIVITPSILIYAIFQKYITSGLTAGALKG